VLPNILSHHPFGQLRGPPRLHVLSGPEGLKALADINLKPSLVDVWKSFQPELFNDKPTPFHNSKSVSPNFPLFPFKTWAILSSTMAPPTPLSNATSSLTRLIREEASYHKEQRQQEAAIAKLETQSEDKENEGEEGNREFTLTQQVCFRFSALDLL
jgi:hypothetical protein